MALKPIETVYDGYRFRSRLEARWAVFLNSLGVPYEYEKEGYDLDGLWYLPDFWLPTLNCWIEVKPDSGYLSPLPSGNGVGYPQAARLARIAGYEVYVFEGTLFEPARRYKPEREPDDLSTLGRKAYPVVWGRRFVPEAQDDEDWGVCFRWVQCVECVTEQQPNGFVGIGHSSHYFAHYECTNHVLYHPAGSRIVRAYTAARQARFEHGERG